MLTTTLILGAALGAQPSAFPPPQSLLSAVPEDAHSLTWLHLDHGLRSSLGRYSRGKQRRGNDNGWKQNGTLDHELPRVDDAPKLDESRQGSVKWGAPAPPRRRRLRFALTGFWSWWGKWGARMG